ncbi:MAG: hypothetical protein U1U88_002455 [Lawsonella clevelandensis]
MVDVLKQAIRAWQTVLAEPVTIHVDGTPFSVTPRMIRRARGRARSSRRPHNRARQMFHDTLVEEIVRLTRRRLALTLSVRIALVCYCPAPILRI